jgi:hypothetical protein
VQAGDQGATLAFPLLYWPGWQAQVDGQSTPVSAVTGSGYLSLTVPPGEHTVQLKLGRTPLRAQAETLSLVALVLLLALTLWRARPLRVTCPVLRVKPYVLRFTPYALRFTLYALLILFLVYRSPAPANTDGDLTMDFAVMPYLHHNPDGVNFANQARLLNYELSSDQPAPGDTLTVTLNWEISEPGASLQATLRLVSPAEHLHADGLLRDAAYTLAQDSTPLAVTTVHQLKVPGNIPRGVYLLQLSLRGPEGDLPARTPSGAGRGLLYLRPVYVVQGAPLSPDAPLLALAGPDIRLHAAEISAADLSGTQLLDISLEWSTARRLAANYGVSVRLLDPNGDTRAAQDTQPGYGLTPTSLWRPGQRIGDRYILPLPGDLPPGEGYRLLIVFYRFPSLTQVAQVALGPFALPLQAPVAFEPPQRLFQLPPLSHPLDVAFTSGADGDHIRLAGYDLTQDDSFSLTLWWLAQNQPQVDYTVFVHLFDPQTEAIPVQHDAMPRQGSYPTSNWLAGEIVSDMLQLDLGAVPPGNYRLAVGLYDGVSSTRLSPLDSDGVPLPHQRLVLPGEIEVSGE